MSKIKFPDGACLKGTITGTQLLLVNEENTMSRVTVDLSSFKRIKITPTHAKEIEFANTEERRKILETYTMHIEEKEKHFIWIVADYVPQINQKFGDSLPAILLGIGTDNPRNGRGHCVGHLSDTSTPLNIQITKGNGKTSVTIQRVGDLIPATEPAPPPTQTETV